MSFQDKSLTCADCGATFTFTAQEQEFFQSKGYTNEPKRCPTCREARKAERGGGGGGGFRGRRQMYPAVCAQCGKETEVPFEPRSGRPVYCSDCYSKVKPAR
ncbi:MAG: zinc-ribbon domain containing protein [Dehalococcoidales bacterium]|nr:zinc-ribbon domain containing protein [Dehalococcoidales bacterium]